MGRTRQRTFKVNGEKITVKSYARTSVGNPCGFYVFINGVRFFHNSLFRQEAEDACYVRWVKEHRFMVPGF
jgi:hypothetical protein